MSSGKSEIVLEIARKHRELDTLSKAEAARRLSALYPEYTSRQFEKALYSIRGPKEKVYLKDTRPKLESLYRGSRPFTELTIGEQSKTEWVCELGHSFSASPQRMARKDSVCTFCNHQKLLVGFNDLRTQYPKIASEWAHTNEIESSQILARSNKKADWVCSQCSYSWKQMVANRTVRGAGCPKCSARSSGYEKTIHKLIESLYPGPVIRNGYPIHDESGKRLQIDIYLPEIRVGIEIQDFATHSRASDSDPLAEPWRWRSLQNGSGEFKKGPLYHENKRRAAKKAEIALHEFWEDELSDMELLAIRLKTLIESHYNDRPPCS